MEPREQNIPNNLNWKNILRFWSGLHQQQHAAELITFLQEVCRIPSLRGTWSARQTADGPCPLPAAYSFNKDRTAFMHPPVVMMPCFQGTNLTIVTRSLVPYAVSALIVHHGKTVKTGHHTARLFQKDGTMWATDDGRPSEPRSPDTYPYYRDSYLYLLRRSDL